MIYTRDGECLRRFAFICVSGDTERSSGYILRASSAFGGLPLSNMEVLEFEIPAWLILLIMIIIIGYIYASWTFNTFTKRGIPGPKPIPLFGNVLSVFRKGFLKFDEEVVSKYGTVVGVYEGRTPTLLVADPEILKQIMIKEFHNFVNRRVLMTYEPPFDNSLLGLKGNHWKRVRSLLTPALSSGKLKQMTKQIHKCAHWLVEHLTEKAEKNEHVDMRKCAGAFSMDVISGTVYGIDTNSLKNPEDKFVGYVQDLFKPRTPIVSILLLLPSLGIFLQNFFGLSQFRGEAKDFFVSTVKTLIEDRRNNKIPQMDIMQLMVNAQTDENDAKDLADEKANGIGFDPTKSIRKVMTTDEIIAQGLLFFLAGSETTGTTVSFFTYAMATHPDMQERLIEEIDRALGYQENISPEMFENMLYLDMCLRECLRIYNPSIRVNRMCNRDTEIKGITIPKGTVVGICIHAVHHNPEFWPDPYKFDPERFSPENKKNIIPMTYIPFGFGPRACIGMRLAYLEIKIAIIKLFQNFRFRTCEQTPMSVTYAKEAFLQPVEKLNLMVERREQ